MDSHPGNPGLWEDWNFNGLNDSTESYFTDSDGDGTSDAMDTHPSNPALWDDQNSNGVNDADEVVVIDSDGDGYADTLDTHPGDTALYNDHDNNGTNDELEAPPDDDTDAMPDSQDPSPQDQDNDGLTDTEEYLMGTDPGEVDTDGDGLADGMEAYVGTDPLNVDTDGDGLTDFEELMAYHTDPLSATGSQTSGAAGGGEEEPGAAPGEGDGGGAGGGEPTASPGQAEIDVRLVMDAVTQESFDLRQGSLLSFPSTSGRTDQSDLKKTFVIQNSGSAPLSGLQFQLTGADQAAFEVSVLAADTLSPGSSATFTLTFKAPSASATKSLVASLLIASNDADESVFELQLVSVSGFWHAQRAYFFADLSDSDHDGIPDRVEDMYAPLVVTPDGDLDGDGVGNLAQYLAGLDLRGGSPAGDFDGDEISDAVEDAWSRHAPGALNKYRFKDAFQDPDGDGLLTLEEVNGWWGGRDDPAAVATHPFKNCTGPNNAGTAPTYNVAVRTPPLATGTASEWFNRESELSAWMNDGLLRLACRERGGSMTVAAFFASKYRYKKSGSSASYGYDHLPAGYLAWLGLNAAAIPATTSVLPVPPSEVAERIAQRKTLLLASDPDQDGMPSEWEAVQKFPKENVFCLDWRNPSDASLPAARTFLQQQISGLTERIQALGSQIATATATARQSLINQRTLLEVERTARQQVLDSRLGSDGQTGAVASPHSAMIGTSNVHQTLLIEPYLIAAPKAPAALANPPAETASAAVKAAWELKRDAWVTAFTNRLPWEILNKIDPDHDGLVNADEHLLGLSPRLPDYLPTGGRDSDGDGFTDAQELTAGTNHLDRTQFPPFTLHIISGSSQVVKIHQEFPQPLVLEARRADGTPQPGIALTVTTSRNNNLVLLSGSAGTDDWWPKTLQIITGADGRATIRVKAPNTAGALTVTATAAIKTTTKAAFSTMVNTLIGDADGDGMPDAWETRAAQNGQPAHGLNKLSALDASASPLNHGYHRDTPPARLPQDILSQLLALRDTTGFLSDYSSNTPQATDRFTTAQRATLALVDPDHDGWSNLEEHQNGTHPRIADNPATAARDDDQDGLPNLWEHRHGLNFNDDRDADLVLDPALTQAQRAELMDIKEAGVVKSYPEAYAASWGLSQLQWEWMRRIDPDHDGWTNLEEFLSGTNPRVADTTYLRVRRGGVQTAIAGQPLPEPVVVQAVREVVDSTGERALDSVMADEEVTFSGPDGLLFRPGSGLAGSDSSQGANPYTLRTDEAGYLCVNVQAPAQVGRYTFFTSLGNGLKTALSLEVLPSETGGGPGGPGTPGGPGGPGEPGPNPPFELKWKFAQSSSLDVSVHRFDYMHKTENGEINTSSHAEVNDWKDGGTVSNYDFYPNASYSVVPSMGVLIAGSRPPNLRLVDPLYSESRVLLSCYSQANGYSQTEPGFKTVRSKVWQQTRPVLVAVTPGTSNQVALPAGHDVLVLLERIETKGGTLYEPGTPTSDTTYQTFTIHIDESGQAAVPESIMSQTGYIDSNDDNTAVTNTLRLLPIDLKEAWSDQITDVEANGMPDATGNNNRSYIIMGARQDGKGHAKLKLGSAIAADMRSKILWRLAPANTPTSPSSGSSTYDADGTTVRVTIDAGSIANADDKDYVVVVGYDQNGDGNLASGELLPTPKRMHDPPGGGANPQSLPFKFTVVSQARYTSSKQNNDQLAASVAGQFPSASELFFAFGAGTQPPQAMGYFDVKISRTETGLTHPIGIKFTPRANPGDGKRWLYDETNVICQDFVRAQRFKTAIKDNVLNNRHDEIAQYFADNPGEETGTFSWTWEELTGAIGHDCKAIIGILNPFEPAPNMQDVDMWLALGKVKINGTVTIEVHWINQRVTDVWFSGTVDDIYDFDYDDKGVSVPFLGDVSPARAAEVQAGFDTLGPGGGVFLHRLNYNTATEVPLTFDFFSL